MPRGRPRGVSVAEECQASTESASSTINRTCTAPPDLHDSPKAAGPSGRCLMGDLPLLEDPDGVAEWVADAQVGAVEVLGGLLGEVGDAARLEGLVQTPDVVRLEHKPSQRALCDQLTELRSGGVVMHRRARLLEGDLGDVTRDAHRQPAVGTLRDVLAFLQPELVDVEVKSLVLVEDHDGGDVEFGDHRSFSPLRDLRPTC